MTTWQIILIPVGLVLIGLVRQLRVVHAHATRADLAGEFLTKFVQWCAGHAKDHSLYNWLLDKSEAVQAMLGATGLMSIRRPFENGYHQNVPVILNEVPQIQSAFFGDMRNHSRFAAENLAESIRIVDCCLRRFIGSTEEQFRRERKRLLNPLSLFCGGVAWLLGLPLFILSETGIITASRRAVIVNGRLFSLLSGILALAALAGTIITIVTGWERFVAIVTGWVK